MDLTYSYTIPVAVFRSSSRKFVGEEIRKLCGFALPLQPGTKAATPGKLVDTSQHGKFIDKNNIGICGFGVFDFDDVIGKHGPDSESGKSSIGFLETLIRFGDHLGVEMPECPIVLTGSGAGLHVYFQPVAEWETTDQVTINGGDPLDVGCGHVSPTGTFGKLFVCPPSTMNGHARPYRWLCSEHDPLAAFLEHTRIPDWESIPDFLKPSVAAAIRWAEKPFDWQLPALPRAIIEKMVEESDNEVRVKPFVSAEDKKAKIKAARPSPFVEFSARERLVKEFIKRHKKATNINSGDLSPLRERPNWLAFCSFVVHPQNWDYSDEALEILLDTARSGEVGEKDEKQIEKDFHAESFCEDTNIVATAGNIARWNQKLREDLVDPEVVYERQRLEERGLYIVRFGNNGNQALDLKSIVKRFEGGEKPSDSYKPLVTNGLKNYSFLGEKDRCAMADLASILPVKDGWLWPDRLRGAAEHYLCHPTDYSTLNIFPLGVGPFARDPLQSIRLPSTSLVTTYRGIRFTEEYWPPNPLDNDDLLIWVEALKWWAKTPDELHWLVSWLAHGIQNPWESLPTSPVIGGKTRSGKTRFMMAVRDCFTTGSSLILLKIFVKKFNVSLVGQHFLIIDEVEDAGRFSAEIKTLPDNDTIMIEPKGIDAHEVINMVQAAFVTNHEDCGLATNGGGGRYTILFNFAHVVEDVGNALDTGGVLGIDATLADINEFAKGDDAMRQALYAQRIGSLLRGHRMPQERRDGFIAALTAYLANYKCCDLTSSLTTDSKRTAEEAEKQSAKSPDKVGDFVEFIFENTHADEVDSDGWLRWLPVKLYSLASAAAVHNKYVEKWTKDPNPGKEYEKRKIPMQTSLLMDMLKVARDQSNAFHNVKLLGDRTTISNLRGRLAATRKQSANNRPMPVVAAENATRNMDAEGQEVKCVHIHFEHMLRCRNDD